MAHPGDRIAVVTLFRGSVPVAVSACWPGHGTKEAKRLTAQLGHSKHRFYDHIKVREYEFVEGDDGIQRYIEPRRVKRYGFR